MGFKLLVMYVALKVELSDINYKKRASNKKNETGLLQVERREILLLV